MARQWYYAHDGQPTGPLPEDQILALLASGTITPETLLWTDGMEGWVPATELTQAKGNNLPARQSPDHQPTQPLTERPAPHASTDANSAPVAHASHHTGTDSRQRQSDGIGDRFGRYAQIPALVASWTGILLIAMSFWAPDGHGAINMSFQEKWGVDWTSQAVWALLGLAEAVPCLLLFCFAAVMTEKKAHFGCLTFLLGWVLGILLIITSFYCIL